MLYANGINIAMKKAGTASKKSSHRILPKDSIINIPTTIKAGAVAADGTIPIIGAIKIDKRNKTPTVTDVRPVLPPAPIPAALSTYVSITCS